MSQGVISYFLSRWNMIFWMSLVLNRTVAVAFKYLKRVKHKSDILSGLNIMQPVKKMKTHEKVLPFQDLICIILKHEIGTNFKCVQLAKFIRVYI